LLARLAAERPTVRQPVKQRDVRGRAIMDAISMVLMAYWDPIGVKDEDLPDEYDAYVGGVYRLLASGATELQIAEHLSRVEVEAMGFRPIPPKKLLPVARKLLSLNIRLDEGPAA
jgi:hypothetical protein